MPSSVREFDRRILGLRTVVSETGPSGREEAVVFLHGHPGSSRDWHALMNEVGEFARAVAFDQPGFGRADKPRDWDYSAGTLAVFVAAALDELGVRRAHLVMHDLGGASGLLWAASHPKQFASAVLMGTGIFRGFKWHPIARINRAPLVGELFALATNRVGFRFVVGRTNPNLPAWFLEQLWADYDLASRRASLRFYRAAPPSGFERLSPVFARLDRPALVLFGQHDPFVSVEQAEHQRQSFPHADVVVLETGHWPHIEKPEEASRHICGFLQRQLATA